MDAGDDFNDEGGEHSAVFAAAEADKPGARVVQVELAEIALDLVVAGGVHRWEGKGRRRCRSSLFFASETEGGEAGAGDYELPICAFRGGPPGEGEAGARAAADMAAVTKNSCSLAVLVCGRCRRDFVS